MGRDSQKCHVEDYMRELRSNWQGKNFNDIICFTLFHFCYVMLPKRDVEDSVREVRSNWQGNKFKNTIYCIWFHLISFLFMLFTRHVEDSVWELGSSWQGKNFSFLGKHIVCTLQQTPTHTATRCISEALGKIRISTVLFRTFDLIWFHFMLFQRDVEDFVRQLRRNWQGEHLFSFIKFIVWASTCFAHTYLIHNVINYFIWFQAISFHVISIWRWGFCATSWKQLAR